MCIRDSYNTIYRLPELKNALNKTVLQYRITGLTEENRSKLPLLRNEISLLSQNENLYEFNELDKLNHMDFNHLIAEKVSGYIDSVNSIFLSISNSADRRKDRFIMNYREELNNLYNTYHNDHLEEIVRKIYEKNKILEYRDRLIQNYDPIYRNPGANRFCAFRTQFFAPTKVFMGLQIDTYTFNMIAVWLMSLILYILLYFNIFERILNPAPKK